MLLDNYRKYFSYVSSYFTIKCVWTDFIVTCKSKLIHWAQKSNVIKTVRVTYCSLGYFYPIYFYFLPFPASSLFACVETCCPDEFNSITPWYHRSHYSEASREHSNKQMKMILLQPVHSHIQPWERLHLGYVQNKNLSLDYFWQNKSRFSDTHSNLRARKIAIQ